MRRRLGLTRKLRRIFGNELVRDLVTQAGPLLVGRVVVGQGKGGSETALGGDFGFDLDQAPQPGDKFLTVLLVLP